MAKTEIYSLLVSVMNSVVKEEYNSEILDFLSSICVIGTEANMEIQNWIAELLIGKPDKDDIRELNPSALAWTIRKRFADEDVKDNFTEILDCKLHGIMPE
jgi:hypothetical protein